MTVHEQYQNDLKAYIDNELPLLRRLAMRRHVDTCRACREELMQMAQVTEELRADEAQEGVSTGIDSALKDKIVGGYSQATKFVPYRRTWFEFNMQWFLGAAASVVTVAVLAAIFFPVFAQSREKARSISAISEHKEMELRQMQAMQDESTPAAPSAATPTLAATPPTASAVSATAELVDRRVHNEATISVDVDDPETRGDDIASKIKLAGGFVATNHLSTDDAGRKIAQLTIKVPVAQFEPILAAVSQMGEVTAKNVTGEDITEKVSDAGQEEYVLTNEVSTAQTHLKQLGKNATWNDTETARDLRIQLAQSRARLVLLKKLGELSDMDITLTQKTKPTPPPASGFMSGMSDTTNSALGSMLSAVSVLLTVVIWILIYAPIWLPAALVGRWLYRRYRTVDNQTSA